MQLRRAWLHCEWRGPTKGHLNPLQEAKAITERVNNGVRTLEEESAQLNGSRWEEKHPQRAKEVRLRVRDGLQAPVVAAPGAVVPEPDLEDPIESDSDLETEETP